MTTHQVDFIIVGQGLAGTCVALSLKRRGKTVFVVDQPEQNRATAVAAGLFNPITGKQMGKTWRADQLFPFLDSFYAYAEKLLGQKFFYPTSLYRPFVSIEEQNSWMGASADVTTGAYLEAVLTSPHSARQVHDPFGGLILRKCGYVDTNTFVDAVRTSLLEEQRFAVHSFDEAQLQVGQSGVQYEGVEAKKIIYCQGLGITGSRFFPSLPLRPLKGEVLTIKTTETLNMIYNRGVYVVPFGDHLSYKVGATYAVNDPTPAISTAGFRELSERLHALLNVPFTITGHDWGMRPTTPDRRPILGASPAHPNVVIFNGLGTKGVTLAPFFSDHLVNWLTNGTDIDTLVDVRRFYLGKRQF